MMFFDCNGRKKKVKKPYIYQIDWDGDSRSKFQKEVKECLRQYWIGNLVYEEFPMVGSRLKFDFFNASQNIIVEADGKQHIQYVEFFHKNRGSFLTQIKRDEKKEEFCKRNGILLIRLNHGEDFRTVLKNLLDNDKK